MLKLDRVEALMMVVLAGCLFVIFSLWMQTGRLFGRAVLPQATKEEVNATIAALQVSLSDPDPAIRKASADALGKIGLPAKSTSQALATMLLNESEEPEGRLAAADALKAVHADDELSVRALLAALQDESPALRESAVHAIGRLGAATPEVVRGLILALRDESWKVREHAGKVLRDLNVQATPELIAALEDPDESVRRRAANVLGELGEASKPAIPALVEALASKDKAPEERAACATALGGIDPRDPIALRALLAAMGDADEQVRDAASGAIQMLGKDAVSVLVGVLTGKNSPVKVRVQALDTLGQMKKKAAAAQPILNKILLNDESEVVRVHAAEALGRIVSGK